MFRGQGKRARTRTKLVCEVYKEKKKDERYFEFDSNYQATHLRKHHCEELKNRTEVKIEPKKVQ